MTPAPTLAIVILAAGRSTRMGQDKLLMKGPYGRSMLQSRIHAAICTGHPVYVALSAEHPARLALVQAAGATALICPDAYLGIGHTLAHAITQIPDGLDAVMIVLADMPDITTEDMLLICDHYHPDQVVRGCDDSARPGHPVLIPAKAIPEMATISQDQGAATLLEKRPTRRVRLPKQHATTDLDTPRDWRLWMNRVRSAQDQ